MKKNLYTIISVFLMSLFLVACGGGDDGATNSDEGQESVTITISSSVSGETEELTSEELEVSETASLLEVMEENFDVETTEDGFITSIEGESQDVDNGHYWLYEVNEEEVNVGANDYDLEDGDAVEFELQPTE